jgi:carboxyl-terminal processing protease
LEEILKKPLIACIAFIVALGPISAGRVWGQSQPAGANKMTSVEAIQLFNQVLDDVEDSYHRKVETPDLIKAAINGMLGSLDPYSEYMEADEASELKIMTQGAFGGIGIHIGSQEGKLTVIDAIEGTPASRAGIMAGDRFMEIEGKSTQGMTIQDAVDILRGAPGTPVKITMQRDGVKDLMNYTLAREVIKIHAVPFAGKLDDDVGYVRLADFSQTARQELESAVDSLVNKVKVKKLIFDLRLNGGGLLQEGFEVGNLFLPKGSIVVTTTGRTQDANRVFPTDNPNPYDQIPMVVLVDRGTASAAEIAAGAMQDYERAIIVGETTFGKGTVQTPIPMPNNATLKLTTALWHTPSGRCVDVRTGRDTSGGKQDSIFYTLGKNHRLVRGWSGIVPDVYVPYPRMTDFEMKLKPDWMFEYSVTFTRANKNLARNFSVTPQMLDDFKKLLKSKNFTFTDSEFDSANDYITRSIRSDIANNLWGTYGEYETRLPSDEQVMKAVELLSKANTEQDLFDALPKPKTEEKK